MSSPKLFQKSSKIYVTLVYSDQQFSSFCVVYQRSIPLQIHGEVQVDLAKTTYNGHNN